MIYFFCSKLFLPKRSECSCPYHMSAELEPFGLPFYFSGSGVQLVAEYLVLCSLTWLFTPCMKFCFSGTTNDDIKIVLQCLDVMLAKRRKQVSQQRALAFLKRLSTLALHVLPNCSVGILATNRVLMQVSFSWWIF